MRVASIDIGTNTCLLLIAEIQNNSLVSLFNAIRFPRSGENVDKTNLISKISQEKLKNVLIEYKSIISNFCVEKIFVVATSSFRDTKIKIEILNFIKTETDLEIEVLSGDNEAKLTFIGALHNLNLENKNKISVFDIGGGSTEITTLVEKNLIAKSIDVGAVRLKEKFFENEIPKNFEIKNARKFIQNELQKFDKNSISNSIAIGVAGTVTTVAGLKQKILFFDEREIHNTNLNFSDVTFFFEKLKIMHHKEILNLSTITKGREDIIFSGVLILYEVMKFFNWEKIIVSTCGLRYGVLLKNILGKNF